MYHVYIKIYIIHRWRTCTMRVSILGLCVCVCVCVCVCLMHIFSDMISFHTKRKVHTNGINVVDKKRFQKLRQHLLTAKAMMFYTPI